jgi:hypothetical protein
MSAATFVAESRVPTDAPQRVMTRLCKHFAHKTPVELDDDRGRIEFRSGGFATLQVAPDTLDIRVTAADAETLTALLGVVERHLKMVEFRDAMPVIDWTRVPGADAS